MWESLSLWILAVVFIGVAFALYIGIRRVIALFMWALSASFVIASVWIFINFGGK